MLVCGCCGRCPRGDAQGSTHNREHPGHRTTSWSRCTSLQQVQSAVWRTTWRPPVLVCVSVLVYYWISISAVCAVHIAVFLHTSFDFETDFKYVHKNTFSVRVHSIQPVCRVILSPIIEWHSFRQPKLVFWPIPWNPVDKTTRRRPKVIKKREEERERECERILSCLIHLPSAKRAKDDNDSPWVSLKPDSWLFARTHTLK